MSSFRLKTTIVMLDIALIICACSAAYIRYKEHHHLRYYKTAAGQITKSEVLKLEPLSKKTNEISYRANINYEYTIDERKFYGTQIRWHESIIHNKSWNDVNAMTSHYRRGKIVPVYYDPHHPNDAVLDLSFSYDFIYLTLILMFVSFTIGFIKKIFFSF